jgi:trigger factor
VSREAYLRVSGKTEEELLREARPDAERALRREAVLAAIVEAEGIEPSEDDLLQALEHSAEHEQTSAGALLERLRRAGRLDALRREAAHRQAVDLVAREAQPIPVAQARARDKLWTPGKEETAGKASEGSRPRAGELWTPGS